MRYRLMKVLFWIRSVPRILRNLKDWFPILVKDYPWDYYYLLAIMKKKIELMRVHLEEYEIGYEGWRKPFSNSKKPREHVNYSCMEAYPSKSKGRL